MGVHGLWRLIEPSGKPVPLETLENKVLAVDVSIWLHQIVKGLQDSKGAPLPNAHLLGIYHRICKLLYFRIKPVFVFDGGVPVLKKQTIAKRNQLKQKNLTEADRIHRNLLNTLLKHSAISKVLSEKAKAAITAIPPPRKSKHDHDDLYKLPPSQSLDSTLTSSVEDEESSSSEDSTPAKQWDLHSIDTNSVQFKSLPVDVRHEILTDLKETRKQSSWGRIHELPTESDGFSVYQMRRLLKRQSVQNALEEAEKEMGGHSLSLGELEKILKDQGVLTNTNIIKGNRIASDENTRFLLIKDLKQALEDARKQSETPPIIEENSEITTENEEEAEKPKNKGEVEFEDELKKAIALSLQDEPSTSKQVPEKIEEKQVKVVGGKGKKRMPLSFLENLEDADFDDSDSSEDEAIQIKFTSAERYMLEYSGLTPNEIAKIIASKSGKNKKYIEKHKKEEKEKETNISNENIKSKDDDKQEETKEVELDTEIVKDKDKPEVDEVTKSILGDSEEKTESNTDPIEQEPIAIEEMSDSDSDNDFVDVDEDKTKMDTVESMEITIKPDEKPEDDLFEDVFADKDTNEGKIGTAEPAEIIMKPVEESDHLLKDKDILMIDDQSSVDDKSNPMINVSEENNGSKELEKLEEESDKKEENVAEVIKSDTPSLKDKIERMIMNYSKPKSVEDKNENQKLTVEQMNEMRENLRKEEAELAAEKSTRERLAGNITDQMYQEAQELLELFGVPYVIAPMEAEAQCAFLDIIELTDGTITEDSDIWLFGGRTVYKNFFNQGKHVLEFKSENIQHHFKLTREQMILLAMLVGSDYTTGLTGVGPVTALEILAAFPPKSQLLISGLAEFRSWFNKGKLPAPGRTALRSKLKNLSFTDNFPNPQIIQAYLEPRVETSKEKFTWGKPDMIGLVDFTKQKFGWSKKKTEEILNPILRRMEDTHKQKSIKDYFKVDSKIEIDDTEKKMSKRVKTALNKIERNISGDVEIEKPEPKQRKRVTGKKKAQKIDEDVEVLKETRKRSRKRVVEIQNEVQSEVREHVKKVRMSNLHKKEVIPQKLQDKTDMLKNKLKAIEVFKKSKYGPGYVKKAAKVKRAPKDDTSYLSESSSDD